MEELPLYAGFDRRILWTLSPEDRNAFVILSAAAAASTAIVGIGALYGGTVATGSFLVGVLLAAASVLVVGNMFRLLNAGAGFPLHEPIARLELWKPGLASVVVLLLLGAIMMQPVVLALMSVVHGKSGGIIAQGLATWRYPVLAGLLTFFFASLMSASAWLRRFFLSSVRAYERERWIEHRMFVDDAYAEAQEIIHDALNGLPGYQGMQQHYADPPYNTRPLLFGFDPELLERDGVRFIRPAKEIADERERLPEEQEELKKVERKKDGSTPPQQAPVEETKASAEQAIEEHAVNAPAVEEQADDERAVEEQAEDAQAVEEQAVEEQAVEEQAVEEQASELDAASETAAEAEPFQPLRDDELLEDMQEAIDDGDDAIKQADEALKEEERRAEEAHDDEEDEAQAEERAPRAEEIPEQAPEEERADDAIDEADDLFDDDDDDEELPPPTLHYLEIGRMLPPRARRHVDDVAPFIASLTHRDEAVVRGLIRVAPDDLPMHRLFSEWKSLRSILLHNAGFALDHNMASIISIAVGRPTPDVVRRLKAAPRDRRLAGVFAPELARKLLGKRI
jgi:hypothetical protein